MLNNFDLDHHECLRSSIWNLVIRTRCGRSMTPSLPRKVSPKHTVHRFLIILRKGVLQSHSGGFISASGYSELGMNLVDPPLSRSMVVLSASPWLRGTACFWFTAYFAAQNSGSNKTTVDGSMAHVQNQCSVTMRPSLLHTFFSTNKEYR